MMVETAQRRALRRLLAAVEDQWARVHLATIFLLFAAVSGLAFIAVDPPLQAFDEIQHYERSYQLSTGNLFSDKVQVRAPDGAVQTGYGGRLPGHLIDVVTKSWTMSEDAKSGHRFRTIGQLWRDPPQDDRLIPVRFDNTAMYGPVAYAPEVLGIWVTRTVGIPDIGQIYAARFAELLSWLVLMWAAIRIAPAGREIFFVLAVNPLAIWQATTMSPDGVGAGLIALCVAILLRLRTTGHPTVRSPYPALLVLLTAAILAACTIKVSYLPIAALLLLVPGGMWRISRRLLVAGAIFVMALSWHLAVLPVSAGIPELQNLTQGVVDSHQQMIYILHNLPRFFGVVLWNIVGWNSIFWGDDYVVQLSYTTIPRWTPYVWMALLIYAVTLKRPEGAIESWRRERATVLGTIAIGATAAFMVVGALYVGWSYVGSGTIMGIQRRYWIPLTYLAIPLFLRARPYFEGRRSNLVLTLGASGIMAASVLTLWLNYQGHRV